MQAADVPYTDILTDSCRFVVFLASKCQWLLTYIGYGYCGMQGHN